MRGVQKCTQGCSSLKSNSYAPLNCIILDTATDPIYAPGEIFACAMLEDTDKGCMQAVYGYRYDIRLDGSDRIAYSRQNLELDGLALEGSENISAKAVTSTTKNPAVYTQRLPLSSVAEFVAKEWSEHGIG